MGKFLARLLIPHTHNQHQPHLLRSEPTVLISMGIVAIEAAFLAFVLVILPGSSFLAAVLSSVLVEETNHSRLAENRSTLMINPILVSAARAKAEDMATRGYFAHDTPEGLKPWYWLDQAGYPYQAAGENLAVNFVDSRDVVNAWMNSPLHRANILGPQFTEIGIATAEGVYEGKKAIFVVQFFGTPRVSFSTPPSPSRGVLSSNSQTQIQSQVRGASAPEEPSSSEVPALERSPVGVTSTPPVVTMIPGEAPVGFLEKMAVQPRTIIMYVLGFLLGFFLLALALKIFVNIQVQYPVLIANGVFLVGILALLLVANDYVFLSRGTIF